MDGILIYAVAEVILAIHISCSNLLVLWVYVRTRSVRTVTNTYIFSLALTDFLSGVFGIPVTVWSVLTRRPSNYSACLSVHLTLCILCTISTFHMLAIAIDKYSTICQRDRFCRTRNRRALFLLSTSWIAGTAVAIIPFFEFFNMSRESEFGDECHFTVVMDYRYLVYVIFCGTILVPTAIIIFCYTSIYSRIRKEEKQVNNLLNFHEKKRRMAGRRKLIRILLILVFTYAVCWYPLYMINTVDFVFPNLHSSPFLTLSAVVLSHVSCALNPLIYAYGMPGFKKALRSYFKIATENTKFTCSLGQSPSPPGKERSFSVNARVVSQSAAWNPRKISTPVPCNHRRHLERERRRTVDIRM